MLKLLQISADIDIIALINLWRIGFYGKEKDNDDNEFK